MRYVVLVLVLLSGCTTSYRHLSDPRVSNDGYDLVCGGVEHGQKLMVSADVCHNLAPNKGEFIFIEAKYRWRDVNRLNFYD
jgi:hypothetical protein